MPKPIVCLSEQLRQYLEDFRPCFSKRQWKYFVTVLLGLIECEERKTMTGLIRVVGERISLSGLSRFMSKWPWSPAEVSQTWMLRFRKRLEPLVQAEHQRLKAEQPKRIGRPKTTVVTGYLIFDDSVHAKPKGRKMGGLGKHYANSERRVVHGHCLFTGLYVLLGQRCPLPARMYRQKAVCEREGVAFQSKIDMAVGQIEGFEPIADSHTHLLIDSWYHCKRVRKAALRKQPGIAETVNAFANQEIKDEVLSRPGRYAEITPNLRAKEVVVGEGERRRRYILCLNAEEAESWGLLNGLGRGAGWDLESEQAIARMAEAGGPTKVRPAASTASTKAGFSDRKP